MYYDFTLDQEQIFGDPVSSDDWGQEMNFTVDWQATEQIFVIGVLGNPYPVTPRRSGRVATRTGFTRCSTFLIRTETTPGD